MLCMICKQDLAETALICPHCGAMPWQMPESFLNPEQHQVWLNTIYTPQQEHWIKIQALQEEIRSLQEKNAALEKKVDALMTPLTLSSDEFEIEKGILTRYKGKASEVHVPEGVSRIGTGAFYDCRDLTSVVLPRSVTSISQLAFCCCFSLMSVSLPGNVTSIGNWAFSGCRSLKTITLPKGLTSIGSYAFSSCMELKSITIPRSVTVLGTDTFVYCQKLKNARVPKSFRLPDHCFPETCRITRY